MYNLPQIKLEVENMKYQIVHALATNNREVEKLVEQELDRVLESYDFSAEVRRAVHEVISEEVVRFFRHGDGRKAIRAAVEQALTAVGLYE